MSSNKLLDDLSDGEKRILTQFRDTVQDILQPHHDDYFLLRWLRARDFNISRAEQMIRESFKLRKKLNIDGILTSTYVEPEVFTKYCTTGVIGFAQDGCLIRYLMAGMCDIKGITYSLHVMDLIKLMMYVFECDLKAMRDHNSKTGSNELRSVFIIDWRDFNLRQFYDKTVIQAAIHLLRTYQDNYPETLKVAYMSNVPGYFYWLWNVLKRFLDPITLKKIQICRTEDLTWKEELFKMIDPKKIPAFLGGELCDPDGNPECKTIVPWTSKKVPTSFYLKDKSVIREDDPNVKSVVIREKSDFKFRTQIDKPGSTLKWEFQTKDCNISFGIYYKKTNDAPTSNVTPDEVIPLEKVECQVIPECGELLCQKVGQYILHFDNTYSWFTSKHLLYKVTVVDPEDENTEDN